MTHTYYTRIHKISSSGEVLWSVIQEITDPLNQKAIAVSLNGGCIAQKDKNSILALTSSGEVFWENASFNRIRDIQIGEDGAVYVLDIDGLHKLDINGVIVWTNTDPVLLTYTISYIGNNNDGGFAPYDSTAYIIGDTATILGNTGELEKSGYTFAGWNTEADGSGTAYVEDDTLLISTASITLYAVWERSRR